MMNPQEVSILFLGLKLSAQKRTAGDVSKQEALAMDASPNVSPIQRKKERMKQTLHQS